ncbi:hypothetical protein FS749_009012 [Ceratobasidium sp. UAMH 11750]|nr:hypothetical protein FS749_009012 [Ceratobasidium sp. UAMH 11750]
MLVVKEDLMVTRDAREALFRMIREKHIIDLLTSIKRYEHLNPPELLSTAKTPVLHLVTPITWSSLTDIFNNPMLPEPFYKWQHPDNEDYKPLPYVRWVTVHDGLIDPDTGLIYGGYRGALSALVTGVRIWYTVGNVQCHPKIKKDLECLTFGTDPSRWLEDLWVYLKTQLKSLIDKSIPPIEPQLRPGTIHTPWQPKNIHWENSAGKTSTDPVEAGQFTVEELAHSYPDSALPGEAELVCWFTERDLKPMGSVPAKDRAANLARSVHAGSNIASRDPRQRPGPGTKMLPTIPLLKINQDDAPPSSSQRSLSQPRNRDHSPDNALGLTAEPDLPNPDSPASTHHNIQDLAVPQMPLPDSLADTSTPQIWGWTQPSGVIPPSSMQLSSLPDIPVNARSMSSADPR